MASPDGSRQQRSICVYCGARVGARPAYAAAARAMGAAIARRGWRLVYGGGGIGIMGIVADAVLAGGGEVVGVIPEKLMRAEVAHAGITEMIVTVSMHERKAKMADLSDGFVVLPGGLGTLEELFETWTWGQLRYHDKPMGLLDVDGYFEGLLKWLTRAVDEGFVGADHREMLRQANDADELLDLLFTD
ncbi:MAG: TIGR00730 family Rossman fold protein [Planctomycetota bacterium]